MHTRGAKMSTWLLTERHNLCVFNQFCNLRIYINKHSAQASTKFLWFSYVSTVLHHIKLRHVHFPFVMRLINIVICLGLPNFKINWRTKLDFQFFFQFYYPITPPKLKLWVLSFVHSKKLTLLDKTERQFYRLTKLSTFDKTKIFTFCRQT